MQESPVSAGVLQGSIILPIFFLLYINNLLDDATCSIAIYADDLWQELELASELESDLRDTVDCYRKRLLDFNGGKYQLFSFDWSDSFGTIDVIMHVSALEENSSFKMIGLSFSSKLDCLFLFELFFISINLPYRLPWNICHI